MKLLQHKGYYGCVEVSIQDECLYGKIEFINALINYEGETMPELKKAFSEAVEDYLATCKAHGYEPEKSCKGSFNVRIGSDLHRNALIYAKNHGLNLNEFVKQAIESSVQHG